MDIQVVSIFLELFAILTTFPGNTGLSCFSCEDVVHPYQCNVTKTCDVNQVCITAENVNDDFKLSYKLGCSTKDLCVYELSLLGKKKRHLRQECCSYNLCNKYDVTSTTPTTTTQTTKMSTTEIVTSTTSRPHAPTTAHICSGKYYFLLDSSCYYLDLTPSHWGPDPCLSHSMEQAVIENTWEHNDILNFIRVKANYTNAVWLGGTRHDGHGHNNWQWINGIQIDDKDSRWRHGAPHGNLCLLLVGSGWDGHNCDERHPTLCKRYML